MVGCGVRSNRRTIKIPKNSDEIGIQFQSDTIVDTRPTIFGAKYEMNRETTV